MPTNATYSTHGTNSHLFSCDLWHSVAMKTPTDALALRYRIAHNEMRSIDGLQPAEALDELLKYLLVKTEDESRGVACPTLSVFSSNCERENAAQYLRGRFAETLDQYAHYAADLFHSRDFHLSNPCLAKVHEILGDEHLSKLSFDVRSAAPSLISESQAKKGTRDISHP